jgi:hypothetical protein
MDLSPEMLDRARLKGCHARMIEADVMAFQAGALPAPRAAPVCAGALTRAHLPASTLERMLGWLPPGALVVADAVIGGMDVSMNANSVAVERRLGRAIMSSSHGFRSLGGFVGGAAGSLAVAQAAPLPEGWPRGGPAPIGRARPSGRRAAEARSRSRSSGPDQPPRKSALPISTPWLRRML